MDSFKEMTRGYAKGTASYTLLFGGIIAVILIFIGLYMFFTKNNGLKQKLFEIKKINTLNGQCNEIKSNDPEIKSYDCGNIDIEYNNKIVHVPITNAKLPFMVTQNIELIIDENNKKSLPYYGTIFSNYWYISLIIGLIIGFIVCGNYYITKNNKTYATFSGIVQLLSFIL